MWICIVPHREHASKALSYATRSQQISPFYLHTPLSSANGMNYHTCLSFPAKAGPHLPTLEGWKAEFAD